LAITRGWRLQHSEIRRELRSAAIERKPSRKPDAVDRLDLWLSTGRDFDGLWVGTTESEPHLGLRRVEDALRLIKQHDSLHYSRVIHNLERVWVHYIPSALAHYDRSLEACVLDERYVLLETRTLEEIASTIVHEATHAKLERWGITYEEKERSRIEAVCLRRELNFLAKLPHSEPLREGIMRTLEWCISDHDYLSDASFQQRNDQGQVETLRYLGTPGWLIGFIFRVRSMIFAVHRLIRRVVRRQPQP
jgi:hypothetical protein